jgi:hypothetical protein
MREPPLTRDVVLIIQPDKIVQVAKPLDIQLR